MNSDDIIEQIEEAFAGVTRGNGVTLHQTRVLDACGSDRQLSKARMQDVDTRWEDVPDDAIEEHQQALCFLDPEGFRYYLPAYMRWSLRHFKDSDSLSSDSTIYALGPSGNMGVTDWKLERWSVFTQNQSVAILAFLRFMADVSEGNADTFMAKQAIDVYWNRFSRDTRFPLTNS